MQHSCNTVAECPRFFLDSIKRLLSLPADQGDDTTAGNVEQHLVEPGDTGPGMPWKPAGNAAGRHRTAIGGKVDTLATPDDRGGNTLLGVAWLRWPVNLWVIHPNLSGKMLHWQVDDSRRGRRWGDDGGDDGQIKRTAKEPSPGRKLNRLPTSFKARVPAYK